MKHPSVVGLKCFREDRQTNCLPLGMILVNPRAMEISSR